MLVGFKFQTNSLFFLTDQSVTSVEPTSEPTQYPTRTPTVEGIGVCRAIFYSGDNLSGDSVSLIQRPNSMKPEKCSTFDLFIVQVVTIYEFHLV